MFPKAVRWIAFALAPFALASVAEAQTGPELMLEPWQGFDGESTDAAFENAVSARYPADGEVGDGTYDVGIAAYQVDTRLRLGEDRGSPALGYELDYMEIDSGDPMLPHKLVDSSVAIGAGVGQIGGWNLAATAGFGTAGDRPWDESDTFYGKASLMGSYRVDRNRSWLVGISYDGNRTILPDVPMPLISYRERSETAEIELGFPRSSIEFEPADRVTIKGAYVPVVNLTGEVSYRIEESVSVYGSYSRESSAYQLERDPDTRRFFFEGNRLETGVRYDPHETLRLVAAGGYTFSREFSRGWDVRSEDTVRELSNEPYFRAALEVQF
jgi:hypothetical protein